MNSKIHQFLKQKLSNFDKILILGFGKEGQSSYRLLRSIVPDKNLWIADFNTKLESQFSEKFQDKNINFILGENYLENLHDFDIIFKSPGVSLQHIDYTKFEHKITSQSQIFLEKYKSQIIGVTGTKGKSTTVRMIESVLKTHFQEVLLVGNIGKPVFDILEAIKPHTKIVYELSSHQLEFAKHSPKIAVLLNIFQEHLDYYKSYEHYQNAKFNIFKYQNAGDFAIFSEENEVLKQRTQAFLKTQNILHFGKKQLKEGRRGAYLGNAHIFLQGFESQEFMNPQNYKNLVGKHNWLNAMVAIMIGKIKKMPNEKIRQGLHNFRNLPHRLEYVGKFREIDFYNDSIATIPEACISALESLPNTSTLVVGGMNRGINYEGFIEFLADNKNLTNLICLDKTGQLIYDNLKERSITYQLFLAENMQEVVNLAYLHTPKNTTCLLSPAASSFGMFKNFEERGDLFKKFIKEF